MAANGPGVIAAPRATIRRVLGDALVADGIHENPIGGELGPARASQFGAGGAEGRGAQAPTIGLPGVLPQLGVVPLLHQAEARVDQLRS